MGSPKDLLGRLVPASTSKRLVAEDTCCVSRSSHSWYSFDNVGMGMVSVFLLATANGYSSILYPIMDYAVRRVSAKRCLRLLPEFVSRITNYLTVLPLSRHNRSADIHSFCVPSPHGTGAWTRAHCLQQSWWCPIRRFRGRLLQVRIPFRSKLSTP